jgi:hypothetical protein
MISRGEMGAGRWLRVAPASEAGCSLMRLHTTFATHGRTVDRFRSVTQRRCGSRAADRSAGAGYSEASAAPRLKMLPVIHLGDTNAAVQLTGTPQKT